ncbi:DUF4056 domain-containing protein, partial [Klebsiella pneumoniae]|uniref:DUF4056 domain-containing protein n=1 Tax=Klebsiella pneumoniae TaxID=573 RepID=UPI00210E9758
DEVARIAIAVAGFAESELEITAQDNLLIVKGAHAAEDLYSNLLGARLAINVILSGHGGSNALLAEQFLEYFDGFSIGSNDMTQLALGLDRDSGVVS